MTFLIFSPEEGLTGGAHPGQGGVDEPVEEGVHATCAFVRRAVIHGDIRGRECPPMRQTLKALPASYTRARSPSWVSAASPKEQRGRRESAPAPE